MEVVWGVTMAGQMSHKMAEVQTFAWSELESCEPVVAAVVLVPSQMMVEVNSKIDIGFYIVFSNIFLSNYTF